MLHPITTAPTVKLIARPYYRLDIQNDVIAMRYKNSEQNIRPLKHVPLEMIRKNNQEWLDLRIDMIDGILYGYVNDHLIGSIDIIRISNYGLACALPAWRRKITLPLGQVSGETLSCAKRKINKGAHPPPYKKLRLFIEIQTALGRCSCRLYRNSITHCLWRPITPVRIPRPPYCSFRPVASIR